MAHDLLLLLLFKLSTPYSKEEKNFNPVFAQIYKQKFFEKTLSKMERKSSKMNLLAEY